jgi:hypothetical protein
MKTSRRTVVSALSFLAATLAGTAHAVNHAIIVGVDYGRPGQMWGQDAINVSAALGAKANWNAANIITISGNAGNAVTKNAILGAIAAKANALQAGDGFLFYYSGHGSFFGEPGDMEITPQMGQARNVCDESLYITAGAGGRIGDDELTTALNAFNANVNKLSFLDSCFSGGFWNGSDNGDLDRVAKSTLIAAADENSTAPGSSDITNNWLGWLAINNNNFNLQNMGAMNLIGMFNAIKPGAVNNPQQKLPPGFRESYNPEYDSFPGAPFHPGRAEIWTNVPGPGVLGLLGAGLVFARRRRGT